MNGIIEIKAENLGGESILEAPIQLLKSVGDKVKKDEVVFIIETDKTSLEVSTPEDGVITEICVEDGQNIIKGQILAKITKSELTALPESIAVNADNHASQKDSPAAIKLMTEQSVNPDEIEGSGRGGRITKADVLNHISKVDNNLSSKNYDTCTVKNYDNLTTNKKREERVKMTKIRQVIASRLKESQNTAAILTTFNEVDMKNVMDLRTKYKEQFEKKHGVKLGFMSFFTRAVVLALQEFKVINAEINSDEIIYKNYYDIGIAVGTDKGLVVPVIRNADQLSFAELESNLSTLGKKAREGKLGVAEMSNATFTITNGGVYGSLLSTPIINPPQSGILGMHSIQNRPVAVGNAIEIRPMMYIALSYDHRIVDGQGAVTFLVRIKQYIEDPNRMSLII